jgi:hypothetical protein
MPEPRTCHLPNSPALVWIGIECLDQVGAIECHGTAIVVSNMTELGGRR